MRAREIVLATGAIERPIAFANNDRPGVMLATAVRGYVERYGVAPGQRGVVFTNNDDAYRTALTLQGRGDRRRPHRRRPPRGREPRLPIRRDEPASRSRPAGPSRAWAPASPGADIEHVKIAPYRSGKGRIVSETKIPCDFVAVSGGFNPALHLWCHNGGSVKFDDALQCFRPDRHGDAIRCAGAANGTFDLAGCLAEGFAAGERAAKAHGPRRGRRN